MFILCVPVCMVHLSTRVLQHPCGGRRQLSGVSSFLPLRDPGVGLDTGHPALLPTKLSHHPHIDIIKIIIVNAMNREVCGRAKGLTVPSEQKHY